MDQGHFIPHYCNTNSEHTNYILRNDYNLKCTVAVIKNNFFNKIKVMNLKTKN